MNKKRFVSILLVIVLVFTCLPGEVKRKMVLGEEVKAETALSNPRIEAGSSSSGKKVTYDCVWFRYYPQTEIVAEENMSGVYEKIWRQPLDCLEDSYLYEKLYNETDWDENGDIVIGGHRRRK